MSAEQNHETSQGIENEAQLLRALQEQNNALKEALTRAALEAHGFRSSELSFTRRQIYEDLGPSDPRFNRGYRPTKAEVLDRTIGRRNWTAFPTGEVTDDPDPWRRETPEITHWQNEKYTIFTRSKEAGDQEGALPAHEIENMVRNQFPHLRVEEQPVEVV